MNAYFAARSEATLESVCEALSAAFDLPPFEYDSHGTWRYAWSEGRGLRLNVTKARDYRTVETWIPGCPSGVNYQVILTAESELPGFALRLAKALGSEAARLAIVSASDV
ncbi:hypothetical protein EP7_000405 [Isosphaeraceae bacterium EP7]